MGMDPINPGIIIGEGPIMPKAAAAAAAAACWLAWGVPGVAGAFAGLFSTVPTPLTMEASWAALVRPARQGLTDMGPQSCATNAPTESGEPGSSSTD